MNKAMMSAFVAFHAWVYRVSGGRVMGKMGPAPVLLLTTTGRKSGRRRTVPLLYLKDAEKIVIVASLGGAPRHPAWYLNLEANPAVELQIGKQRFAAEARTASGLD